MPSPFVSQFGLTTSSAPFSSFGSTNFPSSNTQQPLHSVTTLASTPTLPQQYITAVPESLDLSVPLLSSESILFESNENDDDGYGFTLDRPFASGGFDETPFHMNSPLADNSLPLSLPFEGNTEGSSLSQGFDPASFFATSPEGSVLYSESHHYRPSASTHLMVKRTDPKEPSAQSTPLAANSVPTESSSNVQSTLDALLKEVQSWTSV
jgi:hypothetical protein